MYTIYFAHGFVFWLLTSNPNPNNTNFDIPKHELCICVYAPLGSISAKYATLCNLVFWYIHWAI